VKFDEDFNLDDYVETHYRNVGQNGATDVKMTEDLMKLLHLAYRYTPIDYTRGDNATSESMFITLTDEVAPNKFKGNGYFNRVTKYDEAGKIITDENGKGIGKKTLGEDGKPVRANEASVGRKPVVRVELYNTENDKIYAIGYLKIEIVRENQYDPEVVDPFEVQGQIFANCDDKQSGNYVETTWDQIQDALTPMLKDKGLAPEDWNDYEVYEASYTPEGGSSAVTFIPQYYKKEGETLPVMIDKAYGYEVDESTGKLKTAGEFYPWYYVGTFELVNGAEINGIHTKILRWSFEASDYQAILFDAYTRGIDNYIEKSESGKFTGVYIQKLTRYVKLVNKKNTSLPDIYVAITLPGNSLYFASGTVGVLKNPYWRAAAMYTEGNADMVINSDIIKKDGVADEGATGSDVADLKAGIMKKELRGEFFGDKIFQSMADYYSDAKFYFRMPATTGISARDTKEGLVLISSSNASNYPDTNIGDWVVNGISGNYYTLVISDVVDLSCNEDHNFAPYGSTVSILKINGMSIPEYFESIGKTVPSGALMEKWTLQGDAFVKAKVIPIMKIDNSTSDQTISLLANTKGTDYTARGFAQDMLNYAAFDEDGVAGRTTDDRPYNQQLSAFIQLVANDGLVIDQPGSMNKYLPNVKKTWSDYDANNCFIMPGEYQTSECFSCYAVQVKEEELCYNSDNTHCYRPFVSDNFYAVRFLRPINWSFDGALLSIVDAKIADQVEMTVNLLKKADGKTDRLTIKDWAGYSATGATGSTLMKNINTYYGVSINLPAELNPKSAFYNQTAAKTTAKTIEQWLAMASTETGAPTAAQKSALSDANLTTLGADKSKNDPIDEPTEPTNAGPAQADGTVYDATEDYGTWVAYCAKRNTDESYTAAEWPLGYYGADGNFFTSPSTDDWTVTGGFADYVKTDDNGNVTGGFAKITAVGHTFKLDLDGDGNTTTTNVSDGTNTYNEGALAYPTEDPGDLADFITEKNKTLAADKQITDPGTEPTAVEHPGVVKDYATWLEEEITPTLAEGENWNTVKYQYLATGGGYTATDQNVVNASMNPVCTTNTLTYDNETGQYKDAQNTKAPTTAPAANTTDTRYVNLYNNYMNYYPQYQAYLATYNQSLTAYNSYLEAKAKYDTDKAAYDAAIKEWTLKDAIWQEANRIYEDVFKMNNEAKGDYLAAKKAYADYKANSAAWALYNGNADVKSAVTAYNKYLADIEGDSCPC